MFKEINILQTASLMARHAAERHSVIAENIANADTPGYKAKDLESFGEAFARGAAFTKAGDNKSPFRTTTIAAKGAASPNGNTVSIEDQMFRSSVASRDHDTALTIYSKALTMLRTSLGGSR